MDVTETSRRNVLISTGTLLAGGGAVALIGSQESSAQINADSLDIPNSEHSSKAGTVEDVTLSLSGNYNFRVENADEFVISLWVAKGDTDYQSLDRLEDTALSNQMGSTYELSGSILGHDDWGQSDFTADPEQTITREVPVRAKLEVFNAGEVVTTATAETVATIEVTNTTIKAVGSLSGDGSVEFETPA